MFSSRKGVRLCQRNEDEPSWAARKHIEAARQPSSQKLGRDDARPGVEGGYQRAYRGLLKELAKKHITVTAVAPGGTMTSMTAWLTDDLRSGIEKATPLGRMAMPDDIADVVAFLASDSARWITGRTLLADGGLV
jgi:hypothetical protein